MFVLQSVIKKKRERSFKSSNETKKKSKIIDCCVEQNCGMNGLIIDIHYVYCSTKSNVIDITTTVKFNNYQSFVSSKPQIVQLIFQPVSTKMCVFVYLVRAQTVVLLFQFNNLKISNRIPVRIHIRLISKIEEMGNCKL